MTVSLNLTAVQCSAVLSPPFLSPPPLVKENGGRLILDCSPDRPPSASKFPIHKYPRHIPAGRQAAPVRGLLQSLLLARRARLRLRRLPRRRARREHPELRVPAGLGHPRHGVRPDGDVPLLGGPEGEQAVGPQEEGGGEGGGRRVLGRPGARRQRRRARPGRPPALGGHAPVGQLPVRPDGGGEPAVRVRRRPGDAAARLHAPLLPTHPPRNPGPRHQDVPQRRVQRLRLRAVPLRDKPRQQLRPAGVRRGVPAARLRVYRIPALPKPHADQRRPQQRRRALRLERRVAGPHRRPGGLGRDLPVEGRVFGPRGQGQGAGARLRDERYLVRLNPRRYDLAPASHVCPMYISRA